MTGDLPGDDLVTRLWKWLPARTDRRRVTHPDVCAAALNADRAEIVAALHRLERAGHAIRDRATGRRAQSWHRGTPPCGHASSPTPPAAQETLWP